MTWLDGRMCVFDLETTSADPEAARIVTACVGLVGGGVEPSIRTWLADPGVDIPVEASAIHGVTTARAQAEGRPSVEVVAEIAFDLAEAWANGIPACAFNATYDLTVLDRELRRHGMPGMDGHGPIIDPFVLDRHVDPYRRGRRTLGATCDHYRIDLDGAHDATADAIAAGRVAWRIGSLHPEIAAMSLAELQIAQATWHAERQVSFAAYLRRVGKPADDVCGDWPLRAPSGVSV